jgi:hypothetical protein
VRTTRNNPRVLGLYFISLRRPQRLGAKYFHEFECRSTLQGYPLQISGTFPSSNKPRNGSTTEKGSQTSSCVAEEGGFEPPRPFRA